MLYLDAGNTALKLARPTSDGWEVLFRGSHDQVEEIRNRIASESVFGCGVVAAIIEALPEVRWLRLADIAASRIRYATPETLGLDRFVACHAAWERLGGAAIVIDAGTAVTIDLIDATGTFRGGVISPGLGILENALRMFAPALPTVPRKPSPTYPPQRTVDALQAGLLETWRAGILHHVRQLHAVDPDADVVLTGSDAPLLTGLGESVPDLMFDGLSSLSRTLSW